MSKQTVLFMIAPIESIDIAFNQTLGYSLKCDTDFHHTRLGWIGAKRDKPKT